MRNFKAIAVSLTAALCISGPALANGNGPSPVQLVLEEVDAAASNTAAPKTSLNSAPQMNRASQMGRSNRSAVAGFGETLQVEGKNTQTHEGIDLVRLDIGTNAARYKALENKFTAAYGAPKSSRGNTQLWEIPTADTGNRQSEMTTIMAGQEAGRYFITVDRRGNDGQTRGAPKAVLTAPRATLTPQRSAPSRPKIDYSIRD